MSYLHVLKFFIFSLFIALSPIKALATNDLKPLNSETLLNVTIDYLKIPVLKNKRPIRDAQTGAIKTQSRILRTSYMRKNCKDLKNSDLVSYGAEAWKGYPLELCTYQVKDSAGQKLVKESSVILLKITDQQMAQWMTNTCIEIKKPSLSCVKVLTEQIIAQSGGQYPVRGIVYEDIIKYHPDYRKKIYTPDGYHEPFCFRDGLTVMLDSFKRNSIDILTTDQKQSCFIGPLTKDDEKVGLYARVIGTSSISYQKHVKNAQAIKTVHGEILSTENWLELSRTEIQNALRTGVNRLMTIWALSNLHRF